MPSEYALAPDEGICSFGGNLPNIPSLSGELISGEAGKGCGAFPLLSDSPGPVFSIGLVNRGAVSYAFCLLFPPGILFS